MKHTQQTFGHTHYDVFLFFYFCSGYAQARKPNEETVQKSINQSLGTVTVFVKVHLSVFTSPFAVFLGPFPLLFITGFYFGVYYALGCCKKGCILVYFERAWYIVGGGVIQLFIKLTGKYNKV